jgi:hypothetical protein
MDRRVLLAGVGSVIAAGVAGCTGSPPAGGGSDGGGETTTTTTTTTTTATTTTTEQPAKLVGKSLEADVPECATGDDPTSASVNREGTAVTVEGSILASDACQTAVLAGATYGADAGELRVAVKTETETAGSCVQCQVRIDYVAEITFENGLPERVVVTHDGEVVTQT